MHHGGDAAETSDFTQSLAGRIRRIVASDPFVTIREIRDELNRHRDLPRVSWWRVFRTLRENKLLTKRARFRYFRMSR